MYVPCLRRAASIKEEYEAAGGEVLLDNEDNDGWLATHIHWWMTCTCFLEKSICLDIAFLC
ncbi:hypothetical protein ACS0TY_019231 [Phlomoides rotata]